MIALALVMTMPFAMSKTDNGQKPWQDPEIVQENRLPMSATFVTDQQETVSLDGMWKFAWSESLEGRTEGFETVAFDDSSWGTIPVPGMWELNGYGDPVYVNVGYAWRGLSGTNPPVVPVEHNHVGQYRRTFNLDPSWAGKQIRLRIGSATSNVQVWVNGRKVGYSEDSKLEATFDITRFVKPGENLIAMEVHRWCDGTYLEDQDFWRFSGIARGVTLFTREKDRLENVRIAAGMDGNFTVSAEVTSGIRSLAFEIADSEGNTVASLSGKPLKDGTCTLSGTVAILLSGVPRPLYSTHSRPRPSPREDFPKAHRYASASGLSRSSMPSFLSTDSQCL